MSVYKKAAGMSVDKYSSNAHAQRESLPSSGIKPTNGELCQLIRDYLWKCELERIHGTKNMPLWPMVFEDGVCTGEPMMLMRVCNRMKKKDGEEYANPNFGRFFVANKVPKIDEAGEIVYNDNGYIVMDLANFQWLDETLYVRQGALRAKAQDLEGLLLHKHGVTLTDDQFWPAPEFVNKLM